MHSDLPNRCTETLPQETYFAMDGVHDMFWKKTYNKTFIDERCRRKYNLTPRYDWITVEYGGERGVGASSNVVFSNGLLDPWSSGGVTPDKVPKGAHSSVQPVVIAEGAHHLDLMFSHPDDPPSVCIHMATSKSLDAFSSS